MNMVCGMTNRKERGERGAVAVEFALILPLLVLLLFGIIEFGQAYNAYITVTHAAREGARLAAVGKYDEAMVRARAGYIGDRVTITKSPANPTPGSTVTVTVSYPFSLNIPLFGERDLTIRSSASMRVE